MANINGTNLAAPIVPFTTNDTFPTHYAKYGKGGYRTVATITERDGIFTALREEGMEVYVVETNKKYTLVGGLLNTNWAESTSIIPGLNGELFYNVQGAVGTNSNLTYSSISGTLNAGNSLYSLNSSYFIHKAGNHSLTGVFNTGISAGCLASLNDGTENTGIGISALNSLVHGNGCVALGTNALKNVEGNFNFALGYKSGELLPGGDFNLFLGAYSGFNEASTISNKLVIETSQSRNGNKDYLIEGDFSQRWVRFNGAVRKRVYDITSPGHITSGTATGGDSSSIRDTSKSFVVNEFQNKFVVITAGTGAGQVRKIATNTSIAICAVKDFTTIPDNTSVYKVIDGINLLVENLNTEYYFDIRNEDFVINLPAISSGSAGAEVGLTVKLNTNNTNKLYILTTGTDAILPTGTDMATLVVPYKNSKLSSLNDSWLFSLSGIQDSSIASNLYSVKELENPSAYANISLDLIHTVFKMPVNQNTTVFINVPTDIASLITNKVYTFEFFVNMAIISTITWPINVTWIGGNAPTFGSIAKYRLVFRTEDAGTTWLGNLAYTY